MEEQGVKMELAIPKKNVKAEVEKQWERGAQGYGVCCVCEYNQ